MSSVAVWGRLRFADPLANHDAQFVGLLLQLAHPLHLHGHVTTDFRDLTFDGVRQFGGSAPPLRPPRGTYHLGLRMASLKAHPDTPGRFMDVPSSYDSGSRPNQTPRAMKISVNNNDTEEHQTVLFGCEHRQKALNRPRLL